jgi:hypothetical protein
MESLHWGGRDEGKWETHTDQPFLVARADKEDITAPQVEALHHYYIEDLCHEFGRHRTKEETQHSIYDFGPSDELRQSRSYREKFINEYLPSRNFEDRFEKVKQKKLAEGDLSWNDATPPQRGIATFPDVENQITLSHKMVKGRK